MIQAIGDALLIPTYVLLSGLFIVGIVYVAARAASIAWYKTKLEHLKRVLNLTKGEL